MRAAELRAERDPRSRRMGAAKSSAMVILLLLWLRVATEQGWWLFFAGVTLSLGVVELFFEWRRVRLLRDCVRLELNRFCPGCGYDLRESRERCPECGRPVDPPDPLTAARRPSPSEIAERIKSMTRKSARGGQTIAAIPSDDGVDRADDRSVKSGTA